MTSAGSISETGYPAVSPFLTVISETSDDDEPEMISAKNGVFPSVLSVNAE